MRFFASAKTKAQISFAVTAKLISAFVFATWIVQCLYFLNLKFPISSHLLCLYSSVCVRPGQKPRSRGSIIIRTDMAIRCEINIIICHSVIYMYLGKLYFGGPMAELVRALISLTRLIIQSSHSCVWIGFEPHIGLM